MHDDNHTSKDKRDTQPLSDEETIQRLLRVAGRRPEIPEYTKHHWESIFRHELNQTINERRRHHRTIAGALCASILLLVAYWITPPGVQGTPIAQVINMTGNSYSVRTEGEEQALQINTPIIESSILQTGTGSFLAITYGNANIRLNADSRLQVYEEYIELLEGHIYIDNRGEASTVTVRTPLAEIRDIGTQFTVTYNNQGVATAVREGAVLVDLGDAKYKANAKPDSAQRISVSNRGEIQKMRIKKQGAEWDWILTVSPPFNIEGRTAYEFLTWSTRETGLQLAFATHRAQRNAQAAILHGDISRLNPNDAIDAVLATTELTADRSEEGVLRVLLTD